MPANPQHKESIIGAIGFIFEEYFSSDKTEFSKQIAEIKSVLTNDAKAKDLITNSEALAILHRAFHEPQKVFFRLEDKGPISFGDIEIVILRLVVDAINKANETHAIPPEEYGWDLKDLKKRARANLEKPFLKSDRAPTNAAAVAHLEFKQSPTKMYSFTVEEREIEFIYHVVASLTVNLPKKEKVNHQLDLGEVPHRFDAGDNDFKFMQQKIKEAFPLAEAKTAEVAVKYLRSKNLLPPERVQRISEDGGILLTHEFYFCEVYKKKIQATEFHDLKREEAAILMDEKGVKLIRERGCKIAQVRRLTFPRLQLIYHPYFDAQIRGNHLTIDSIIAWSPAVFKVFSAAVVINLLSGNIVKPNQIAEASPFFLEIMQCQNYSSLVFSKKIPIELFLKLTEAQKTNLLDPKIILLVEKGILPVEEAMSMPSRLKEFLCHAAILPEVQKLKISWPQVKLIATRLHDVSDADLNVVLRKVTAAADPVLAEVSLKAILMRYFLNKLSGEIATEFDAKADTTPKGLLEARNCIVEAEAKTSNNVDSNEMHAELQRWSQVYLTARGALMKASEEYRLDKFNQHKRGMEAPQMLFASGGNKRRKSNGGASISAPPVVSPSEKLNKLVAPLSKVVDFVADELAVPRAAAAARRA